MRDLNWELKKLCEERGGGSHSTRRDREYGLRGVANDLHGLGYKGLGAAGLRRKHVASLVRFWRDCGVSDSTMKNRMGHVRWWAKQIRKEAMVPANAELGIGNRRYVTNEDKSRVLEADRLAMVRDPHVAMSLRMQDAFGLRREESIKFTAAYADRGDRIVLKASWTKGGRPREVPVTTDGQRRVLDSVRELAGSGPLIAPGRNYRQQRDAYEAACRAVGLPRMHGLRHGYAQRRYEGITGWRCPAAGGPAMKDLKGEARSADRNARQTIAEELGHGRVGVAAIYCGV